MRTDEPLFDPVAQVARARRLRAQGDFLHARAAGTLRERLDDSPRPFARAAILSARPDPYRAALEGRVEMMETLAPASVLAAKAGGYDLILSGLHLHRENDPVGQFIQMRRALKPDGLLLGALFGGRSLQELRACLLEAETAEEGGASPRVAPMADLRDLGALMQRAGFAMPVTDIERLTITYADPLALMRELRAMGEANALSARRRRFTRRATLLRAAQLYTQRFATPDGRIAATVEVIFLSGWAPGPDQPVPKRPGSAAARLADALGAAERSAGEKAGR